MPVDAVTLIVLLAAGLLVPAGIAKLRDPAAAGRALGPPAQGRAWLVRAIGAGELLLAGLVLLVGGRLLAGVLGAAYAAFTVVALRQRARGRSCGCFGASDVPTSLAHVALNLVAASAGAAAAWLGPTPVATLVTDAPLAGAPLVLAAVVAVATAQLTITALPELLQAARRPSTGGDA